MSDPSDRAVLALLGEEPARAEELYRQLRERLLRFFEWNRCASPEDMAHETICRALRRFSEGQVLHAENPHSYFFGVAKNLLREQWKCAAREPLQLPDDFEGKGSPPEPGVLYPVEQRILLGQSLRRLPPEESDLIVRYFSEGSDQLCATTGLSPNAIRIRVHRIRKKLEQYCCGTAPIAEKDLK